MSTMIASFLVILVAFAAMAVGIVLGRAPIRGSCGGARETCAACTSDCGKRAADGSDRARGGQGC